MYHSRGDLIIDKYKCDVPYFNIKVAENHIGSAVEAKIRQRDPRTTARSTLTFSGKWNVLGMAVFKINISAT